MVKANGAEPAETFPVWLLRRVAQAAAAGEVAAERLVELQAEIRAAHAIPQELGQTLAVRCLGELAGLGAAQATETLAAIEAQPDVVRERLWRRIAEAWLEREREADRRG